MVEGILHAPLTPGLSLRTFGRVSFVLSVFENTRLPRLNELIKAKRISRLFSPST